MTITKKIDKNLAKKIQKENDANTLKSMRENAHRVRALTVGTAFGGVVEINMRNEHYYLWAQLQPTEAIELIHQLAANIGCHIHIQPRKDFASWRKWREDQPGLGFNFWAEHPPNNQNLLTQEQQDRLPGKFLAPEPIVKNNLQQLSEKETLKLPKETIQRSNSNEQTVATEKIVRRKHTKRATTSS
jgi:hypothetical protein